MAKCVSRLAGHPQPGYESKAKVLDMANKKRNTHPASRWAMSPVLSSSKPAGFPIRRRAAFSSASLFPVCPDRSPNTRTLELAPLSGPGSPFSEIVSDIVPFKSGADCPPPAPAACGQPRNSQGFQKDAVVAANDAATDVVPGLAPDGAAPLVGIARSEER